MIIIGVTEVCGQANLRGRVVHAEVAAVDGHGDDGVGTVLLLQLLDDSRGLGAVDAVLSGEVLDEDIAALHFRFHVFQALALTDIAA